MGYKFMRDPKAPYSIQRGGVCAPEGVIVAEIEAGASAALTDIPQALACLTDRTYGQTRIILWTQYTTVSPSTPEPSTP